MAYVVFTLLSDEAVGTLCRALLEGGYTVRAGMEGNKVVAGPVDEWCGRVVALVIESNTKNLVDDIKKAAERINYLSAVISGIHSNGTGWHVLGPHFVDEDKARLKNGLMGPSTAHDHLDD